MRRPNDDEDVRFFIEGSSSSESEPGVSYNQRRPGSRTPGDRSPPLVLAFSLPAGRVLQDSGPSPARDPGQTQQEEHSDESVEEWMILGEEEQEGDMNIQLNLGYWSSSGGSDEDSENEDENPQSVGHPWAVSEKDKSLPGRYYTPGRSLTCHHCNKTGHLAKGCPFPKKCPTCVLCGIRGHVRRGCPGRHCPSCGLPSHGHRPCPEPPVWNQHCQRCGVTGHLSDACPDTWRQYHLTVRLEAPHRPPTGHAPKRFQRPAHCYNCSERGHFGYECTRRRMVSGTFPTLPYVFRYDTEDDILQRRSRMQRKAKELGSPGFMPPSEHQHLSEPMWVSGEENQLVQGGYSSSRRRRSQEARGRDGRRKTWPERRRERREVKKLRRVAQARREGGLLGRSRGCSDDDCPTDPFGIPSHDHRQATPPPQKKKKRRNEERGSGRSRKSREAERWKKRGGLKRGDLYPHGDLGAMDENLLSPKQRVRHLRR
ncbi:uncharacterized protein ACN63O_008876 [Diretmus argenteus]